MDDELTAIPPARRRWLALALSPIGVALLVAAMLAVSLDGVGWKSAGVLVAALALALLGVAWGLWRSAGLCEAAAAEQRLDEVLAAAARSQGPACGGAAADGADMDRAGVAGVGSRGSDSSICDSTGVACGSDGARGCGAGCLTRASLEAGRGNAPQRS